MSWTDGETRPPNFIPIMVRLCGASQLRVARSLLVSGPLPYPGRLATPPRRYGNHERDPSAKVYSRRYDAPGSLEGTLASLS